jgi:hypothetical protein
MEMGCTSREEGERIYRCPGDAEMRWMEIIDNNNNNNNTAVVVCHMVFIVFSRR